MRCIYSSKMRHRRKVLQRSALLYCYDVIVIFFTARAINTVLSRIKDIQLSVPGMTLNCIYIFLVTGSFFVLMCLTRPASQRFFLYTVVFIYES